MQVDSGLSVQLRGWDGDTVFAVSGIEKFIPDATYCEDDRWFRRVEFYLAPQRMDMNIERMFF